VASAPYARLFPRARAVVHHGGIGTLAEAMRAGKPMAIVPFANDQYDNARRGQRSGWALRWSRRSMHGRRLQNLMERLLGDDVLAERAAALGAQIRAEPGGATIAARIIAGR
jgi:rhamnosyltransferase subunit B